MRDRAIRMYRSNLESAKQRIDEFKEKLDSDPAYAFEWSERVFNAAAEVKVYKAVVAHFEDGGSFTAIYTHAMDCAFREVQYPSRSTSIQSNEMARCVASVWAKVAEMCKRGMEEED